MKHDPTLYEPRNRRWCHIFSAIASVASAGMQMSAAKDAAEMQQESAREAAQLGREGLSFQQEMFDTSRADLAPWRSSGAAALGTMNNLFIPGGQGAVQLQGQLNDLRAQRAVMARQGNQPAPAPVQQAAAPSSLDQWKSNRQRWLEDAPGGDGGGGAR